MPPMGCVPSTPVETEAMPLPVVAPLGTVRPEENKSTGIAAAWETPVIGGTAEAVDAAKGSEDTCAGCQAGVAEGPGGGALMAGACAEADFAAAVLLC